MNIKLSFFIGLISLILLSGCSEDKRGKANAHTGKGLYNYYCLDCHIKRGPGAAFEKRDLSRPALAEYKILLLMQYGDTLRHKEMPVYPQLKEKQFNLIAKYVINLQQQSL